MPKYLRVELLPADRKSLDPGLRIILLVLEHNIQGLESQPLSLRQVSTSPAIVTLAIVLRRRAPMHSSELG